MVKQVNTPERQKEYQAPEITIVRQEAEFILCTSTDIPDLYEDTDPFEWE